MKKIVSVLCLGSPTLIYPPAHCKKGRKIQACTQGLVHISIFILLHHGWDTCKRTFTQRNGYKLNWLKFMVQRRPTEALPHLRISIWVQSPVLNPCVVFCYNKHYGVNHFFNLRLIGLGRPYLDCNWFSFFIAFISQKPNSTYIHTHLWSNRGKWQKFNHKWCL